MCYDVQTGHERLIKDGIHKGAPIDQINSLIDAYNKRYNPSFPLPHVFHHVSAFEHPALAVVHLQNNELIMEPMTWGLIPNWVKDRASANKLWNQTPNARSETMFDKPSFRRAARKGRGVVILDSFYEHHHFNKKAYPLNIRYSSNGAMVVAVLWDEWTDKTTGEIVKSFSIVTTQGNEMMSVVHNSTKQNEPRMPLILQEEAITKWLTMPDNEDVEVNLLPLCKPVNKNDLKAFTVRPLRGKQAAGNVPEAHAPFSYPELAFDQELQDAIS